MPVTGHTDSAFFFEDVANRLNRYAGLSDAEAVQTGGWVFCIDVTHRASGERWRFGTGDYNWAGYLMDKETEDMIEPFQELTTNVSSQSDDLNAVANALAHAVLGHYPPAYSTRKRLRDQTLKVGRED